MKHIQFPVLLLLISLLATSCELKEDTSSITKQEIAIKYFTEDINFPTVVNNSYTTTTSVSNERTNNLSPNSSLDFLEFDSKKDFLRLISMPAIKQGFLQDWKVAYAKFYSLEDELNNVFYNYDSFLDQIESKYEVSANIDETTEKQIDSQIEALLEPYSSFVTYSKENGINRKTYAIGVDYLLNKDGIVKIDNKIYQYTYDAVKVIEDGDASKIVLLNEVNETNLALGISVNKVWHTSEEINPNGRVEDQLSACASTSGKYRTIAYEEQTIGYDFRYAEGFTHYYVKLRSLKKKTLWWGNHETGFLRSQGSFTAVFTAGSTPTYTSQPYSGTYHTWYVNLYSSGLVRGLTSDQFRASVHVFSSSHTASGKNDTGCSFGKQ